MIKDFVGLDLRDAYLVHRYTSIYVLVTIKISHQKMTSYVKKSSYILNRYQTSSSCIIISGKQWFGLVKLFGYLYAGFIQGFTFEFQYLKKYQ